MTTEETLMKISTMAWRGVLELNSVPPNPATAVKAFKEIQALADAELAAIQQRREAV